MLENKLILRPITTVNEFLKLYNGDFTSNLKNLLDLDFEIESDHQTQRICPVIELAKEEDADEIVNIFKNVYKGTYPYKRLEDPKHVRDMILDSHYHWFLFKINKTEVVGSCAAYLEFDKKRGLIFGYAIKRNYRKCIDIFKAFVGCVLYLWKTYKNTIYVWYGEVRTNDKIPQYLTSLCGLKPIAFFPNKDIFINNIESDFMHIIYDEDALTKFRSRKAPKIIRQVLNCFSYSNNRFNIDNPLIENPKINLNSNRIIKLNNSLYKKTEKDKFKNVLIHLGFKNSKSYIEFLYNKFNKSIEKTKYKVNNLEELHVFIEEIVQIIAKLKIRYFEIFVSSYKPSHQKMFLNRGFKPRGYIFSWNYDELKKCFQDYIVFNYYEGVIFDQNIKLISESSELLKFLNFPIKTIKNNSDLSSD